MVRAAPDLPSSHVGRRLCGVRHVDQACLVPLVFLLIRPVWWSGIRSCYDAIPTLHWRPDDRLTEGVLWIVCLILFLLTLCTRWRVGCTLLGDVR